MPELPEVETTKTGITPYVVGNRVNDIIIRQRQLRWPIPSTLKRSLKNQRIERLSRRAKYLLFYTNNGCMILHLGMSGSLRVITNNVLPEKHDHVDIVFEPGFLLRFRDPRKFGCIDWTRDDPLKHERLNHLGPEPLSTDFNADYLYSCSRKRSQTIKTYIMANHVVVGVGNIYANEALFRAGIRPTQKAGRLSKQRYAKLVEEIKKVLTEAIAKGGTSLRDFVNGDGNPGYFSQQLNVYDRQGQPCKKCDNSIKVIRLGQRSTFFCTTCQR